MQFTELMSSNAQWSLKLKPEYLLQYLNISVNILLWQYSKTRSPASRSPS